MQTENENVIGKRMRELRGNMSQRQAASCVGMWAQNWNVYESGQSIPGAEAVIKICQYFGVSADWLLGLSDVRDYTNSAAPTVAPPQTKKIIGRTSPRSEADLMAEIRALRARVDALESSPAFACG